MKKTDPKKADTKKAGTKKTGTKKTRAKTKKAGPDTSATEAVTKPSDAPQNDSVKTGEQTKQTEQAEKPAQPLTIIAQYVKDLSFEAPNSPAILMTTQKATPKITADVDVQAKNIQDKTFEVVLNINAVCKMDDDTGFIAELAYAGLFTLNLSREHMKPILLIECPRLLFPFARNIIADTTRDAGFPPLMLSPMDFATMYRNGISNEAANA